MPFQYKRVLLVGATSGIGAAMADKLIQEGAKVIAVGRRQDRLDAFVKKHGPEVASSAKFDITDRAGTDAFVNDIVEKYPDLDCVFLNSGIQAAYKLSRPAEFDSEGFRSEIDTNFLSTVDLMMKFLAQLQAKPYPTALIVTGTNLAIVPATTIPVYSASKAALNAFIYCLRAQNFKSSTKIIEVWPPVVQTELHDYMGEERGRSFGMPVAEFTKQAYAQLAAGAEHIVVGSIGSQDSFRELVDLRKKHFDELNKLQMAHFEP
ncbi:Short-chain dehydrogenase reductase family [Pleurostoma richardsiae]|uniref:Short-chain dehydrogenase reductase family n=1 Tax=Pleurostoma richardsiae TaxID=41990 RepID=A0AA38RXY3_9PEZI|nr:Short-chain dehydrogenase reductase family [Pleurostoma richardsiae]